MQFSALARIPISCKGFITFQQGVESMKSNPYCSLTLGLTTFLVWGSRCINHHHHHHHIALVARISLTLSRHSSRSFIALGRSSGQQPVSSHSCWMYVRAGRPAFARPCVGIHKSTSLMSSSLLLQQCPACLVRLTWIVFVIGGRWPYSWCKRSFFQAAVTSTLLYGCTTWTLTKRLEKKLDGNYTRMLRAILNKSWQQHPTRCINK